MGKILDLIKRKPKEDSPTVQMSGEVSFRDPLLYPKGSMWAPYNPDVFVMRKGGLDIYDKMRRDEQIKSCQWIKRLSVLCSGWNVDPASDEGIDVESADCVKDAFERIPGTFEARIKNVLTGMDYGFSVTEKVWGLMEKGPFRGKVGVSLKTRKPHSWDFDTDEYGNLKPNGLWQLNGQYKYNPGKFIVYSHDKEFDNWYGMSDLQAAYRPWWSKDMIIKFWNVYLERFGMGIPVLHPAEGKQINDPTYTALKNAIFNFQKTSALAWQTSDAVVDLLEMKGKSGGEHQKAVQYYDRGISKSLLMPTGIGFSDEEMSGSFARSKTHFDVWLIVMMDFRKTVEELINENVVRELVDYNYSVKEYPRFRFMPMDDPESTNLLKLWLEAIKGKAVHQNPDDELHFRKMIKFPERDRDELEEEFDEDGDERSGYPVVIGPGGQPEEEDDDDFEYVYEFYRDLTPYEKRVNFAQVEKDLDALEDDSRKKMQGVFDKQRVRVMATVEKAAKDNKITQKWIDSLSLPYGVQVQSIVKETMRTGFENGRKDAVSELNKSNAYVIKMPPEKTISMLEQSAFWIKNVLFDGLKTRIQALLINMIQSGEAATETLMKIREVYDPYVGDEQVVKDQKQIEPYRIETVIRTNVTKAYNKGKVSEFADPELEGFVRAVQVSAILDSRTTSICQSADGKILMMDDPDIGSFTPPLHFQCRTMLVAVTMNDGPFEPTKKKVLESVLSEMPPAFGGNVD